MQQEPGGARSPRAAGPPGPTGQQSCHKCQKVCLGCPRAGISWPQDFSGQRAATSFPRGLHPEVFLHFPHQGAVSIAGDGHFLQKFLPIIRQERWRGWWQLDANFLGEKQALLSSTHLARPKLEQTYRWL
jgi:hypothetical protein